MPQVSTVLGPVDAADLGRTLIHEHVLVGMPGYFLDYRSPAFKRDDALAKVVDNFQRLHDYGVKTVVDPCPSDIGRNVEFIAEVSQKSGINIICATGVYFEEAGMAATFRHLHVEDIAENYILEIENGIGKSGIKPGVVKIATGQGQVTDYERKILQAAAIAAKATGLPVLSHTQKCTCGHDQIDYMIAGQLSPHRLLVGHSCGTPDVEYQASLAARGVYVGFDRFGLEHIVPDDTRMTNLVEMINRGYVRQLMMSHDYVNCWLARSPSLPKGLDYRDVAPNWSMFHIFENILPELKSRGITDDQVSTMLVDNTRAFLTSTQQT
jgi:phosphotriesterase-related protein